MPLQKQVVPISFGKGIDTKSDPKQIVPGKLSVLENGVFQTTNEIKKRNGYTALTQNIYGGGTVSAGLNVAEFQNELVSLDKSNLYSYSPDLSSQVSRGACAPVDFSSSSIFSNSGSQSSPDSAYHSGTGLRIYTYFDSISSGIKYTIIDTTTGVQIVSSAQLSATGTKAKVVTLSNYFVIFYYKPNGNICYKTVSTATPTTLSSETVINTDADITYNALDAVVFNNAAYLVYGKGSTALAFYSLSSTLILSVQYPVTTSAQVTAVTILGDASNNVWCFYSKEKNTLNSATLLGVVVNSNLSSTLLAPTVVETLASSSWVGNITASVSGTTATIFYEYEGNDAYIVAPEIRKNTLTLAGVAGTASSVIKSLGLASKVFSYSGTSYFLALYSGAYIYDATGTLVISTIEPTYFVVSGSGAIIAKIAPANGSTIYTSGILPQVLNITGTQYTFPYLQAAETNSTNGVISYALGVMSGTIDFTPSSALSKIVIGNNLHFSGSFVTMYDGANVCEHGFHVYPENLRSTTANSGGGIGLGALTGVNNKIQYCAVYEWVDNQGQIHRSSAGPALSVTLPDTSTFAGSSFTANITAGSATVAPTTSTSVFKVGQVISNANFPSGTYIVAFNSLNGNVVMSQPATASATGSTITTKDICKITVRIPTLSVTAKSNVAIVLYRTAVNGTIFYRTSSATAPTYNDKTVSYVSIDDSTPDAVLVGNNQLYSNSSEVDNIGAPAASSLGLYKNRAILVPVENKKSFWFSKQVIPGSPVEFSDLFVKNVDSRGGDIVATAQLDDKLIIFKSDTIFCMVGDGPAPSGVNDDFSEAQLITTDCGLSDKNSVVSTPNGLIFKSKKGIYLLNRNLQAEYVGADVESYNAYSVTSALLLSDLNQVRLTLSSGVCLMYDYFVGQWSVFTNISAVDSTLYNGVFNYIDSTGKINQETAGVYNDNGSFIKLKIGPSWLSFAGLQAFQRAYKFLILGNYKSAHSLIVNVYTNFIETPNQTVTIPVTSDPGVYQYRVFIAKQKCESLKITIEDSQTSPIGEGFSLSALSMEVGVKQGLDKIAASKSYG